MALTDFSEEEIAAIDILENKYQSSKLIKDIETCCECSEKLPLGPRPVLQISSPMARIAIISQAPGIQAHELGIPFKDPSGARLQCWLGVSASLFYDPNAFAIIPMGFCYPGKGASGDLPPLPTCYNKWHKRVLESLPNIKLKILVGTYSQQQYLGDRAKKNLTETVRCFEEYLPEYFPIPHPSPRTLPWQQSNPWFASNVLPRLQEVVNACL